MPNDNALERLQKTANALVKARKSLVTADKLLYAATSAADREKGGGTLADCIVLAAFKTEDARRFLDKAAQMILKKLGHFAPRRD